MTLHPASILADFIWERTTLDREWCNNLAEDILDAGYVAPDPAPHSHGGLIVTHNGVPDPAPLDAYVPDPANDETLTMTGYEWWAYRRAIEAEARAAPDPAPLDVCPYCEPEHVWPCPTIPRCDEPGCEQEATCGWPTRPGGTGPNGGYRRTCGPHMVYERKNNDVP